MQFRFRVHFSKATSALDLLMSQSKKFILQCLSKDTANMRCGFGTLFLLFLILSSVIFILDMHFATIQTKWNWTSLNQIYQIDTEKNIRIQEKIPEWQKLLCKARDKGSDGQNLEASVKLPTIDRDITPNITSSNIFFMETSCNPRPTYREWCSVESWAGQHPGSEVWYILTHPFISYQPGMMPNISEHYPNIKVVGANLDELVKDTPITDIFHSYDWLKNSDWPSVNLSDMMRVALVWRWGGFYSDTDVICIKSTKDLSNVTSLQSSDVVNGAIFHGDPRHKFYWNVMKDLQVNFKSNVWAQNGPNAFTRVTKKMCPGMTFEQLARKQAHCANISILPSESFYPISYGSYLDLFKAGKGKDLEKLFKASYTLHFWNKLSTSTAIRIGSESILDSAAKKYCPVTYRAAALKSNSF